MYTANGTYKKAQYFFGDVLEKTGVAEKKPGNAYTFGFNGKENDNEVKGEGNSLDFGARKYDSRLGRWLSVDPLEKKYPQFSPYNAMANNPLLFVDEDGRDITIYGVSKSGKPYPILNVVTSEYNIKRFTNLGVSVNNNGIPDPAYQLSLSKFNIGGDAALFSVGADFAFGGGVGGSIQMAVINKGSDQGVYFYRAFNANLGLSFGAGVSAGEVDFNEESGKELNRETFEGLSQGWSVGILTAGASSWTAYANNETCGPFEFCGPILYEADMYSFGAGGNAGAMYTFSNAALIE